VTRDQSPDLEQALAECLAAVELEGSAAIDRACRDHPHLADELRRRIDLLIGSGLVELDQGEMPLPERLGDYRPEERLGEGAMGVVVRARHVHTGREVALKWIRPEQLLFPEVRARFQREVRMGARLRHPGIVAVLDVGEHQGVPWFAMEWIAGTSLRELLDRLRGEGTPAHAVDTSLLPGQVEALAAARGNRGDPVPWTPPPTWAEFALGLVRDLARALAYAHGRGVLHRDVKPSNVLLGTDGRVHLSDLGLATHSGENSLTRGGAAVGSVPYMPPEVLSGAPADIRADVYGLGALLFECLTLHRPFEADSQADLVRQVLTGDPPRLGNHWPRVRPDLEAVVGRALERDPERRYATASELLEDLEALAAGRPTRARPLGPLARLGREVQRRPARALAVGLGLALLLGLPSAVAVTQARARGELERSNAALGQALEGERRERERADANLERAAGAVDLLLRETADVLLEDVPAMQQVKAVLLQRAAAVLDQLAPEEAGSPRAALQLAEIGLSRAVVHTESGEPAAAALELDRVDRVLDQCADCAAADPERTRLDRARSARWRARLLADTAPERAVEQLTAVLRLSEGATPLPLRRERLVSLLQLAQLEVSLGREPQAHGHCDQVLAELEAAGDELPMAERLEIRIEARTIQASLAYEGGDAAAARTFLESALSDVQQLLERDPESVSAAVVAVVVRTNLIAALSAEGDLDRAELELQRALDDAERLVVQFPRSPSHRVRCAGLWINLGQVRDGRGDRAGAIAAWTSAVEQGRSLLAGGGNAPDALLQAGTALGNLAAARRDEGELEAALELAGEADGPLVQWLALNPGARSGARVLEFARLTRAHAALGLGRTAEGRDFLAAAEEVAPRDALAQRALVDGWLALERSAGDSDGEALDRAQAALTRAVELGWRHADDLEHNPALAPLRARADYPRAER
jgi:serine/threonine protein kinase